VDDIEGLEGTIAEYAGEDGPYLVVVKSGIAPVEGIGRVSHSPTEIRDRFESSVQKES